MYENVELLKKDLKRFPLPLKGKKELEALFPYVQNSQIVLCASGCGPYDSGKNCWFVLTDANLFIVLKASMMGAPSVIAVPLRDIDAAIEEGNERAILARTILCYQITKFIGGYIAALNGLDAIVFTGGIGENTPQIRQYVAEHLG